MKILRWSWPKLCLPTRSFIRHTVLKYSSKKDLSRPLAAAYNPKEVENGWYAWWEENKFFRRHNSEEKFVMILPPPNVTGYLHLGHALTCAIQDALARWHQMNGKRVVWVPGCDHAGIATQVVVERNLWATQGITRHQLGRERFLQEVMKWKDEKGTQIYDQMKRLGVSLDWNRAIYTMDDQMYESVNEAFIQLFNAGLIYRKLFLVNWCCELQSAISNIEVEHFEVEGETAINVPGYEKPIIFGKIYEFAYKLSDLEEEVIVSTTRPETMLGDTAVMVHPEDNRYSHLHGKYLVHPFRKDKIPIITDSVVDPEFGSGAVKVTPAHSSQDFEVGLRHNLQQITIFDEEGIICMSEFLGQPRFTARESVIDALSQLGLFRGSRSHNMAIPRCSRTSDIIEPLLKPQWFVNVKEMAARAVSAVQNEDLKIIPKGYKAVWYEWLEKNIQDWCISRQLWWGHRIPAYCIYVEDSSNESWIAARSEEEAKRLFLKDTGIPESKIKSIQQEEDVLDTWFSSGILPFAAFGWPNNTNDFKQYYPSTLLETGHDILFFWVARMVMLGLQLTEKLPFKTVLLHSLIHDAEGQKMSKSRGNVIDPMDVINGVSLETLQDRIHQSVKNGVLSKEDAEAALKHQVSCFPQGIPMCGADALRISLCACSLENQFVSVDVTRMEQHKFMGNKIWQVLRFFLTAIEGLADIKCCLHIEFVQRDHLHVMDKWILSQLASLVETAEKNFKSFDLYQVVGQFEFFWYKCLCDVYLESIKSFLKSGDEATKLLILQTLWTCIEVGIHVLSPFMPYLTEELYQRLPRFLERNESIMQSKYPQPDEWQCWRDIELDEEVKKLLEVASAIRSLKGAYNIAGQRQKDVQGSVITKDQHFQAFLKDTECIVETLARIGSLSVVKSTSVPPVSAATTTISDSTKVYLHLEGLVDPKVELGRLHKKIAKFQKKENDILKTMGTRRYKEKTPMHIQNTLETKLNALRKESEQVKSLIDTLEKIST